MPGVIKATESKHRITVFQICRLEKPFSRFTIILRYTLTFTVQVPQTVHRASVPHGCGYASNASSLMAKERVLITVKTYPTLSRKYGETVCTAGVRADGTWMRIYPVPYRRLDETEQYRKFDWIETDFVRGGSDPRPETRHPADLSKMIPVGHLGVEDNWRARRELLLKTATVYNRLEPLLIGAKENRLSLAIYKPAKIRGFIWEDDDRDWNPDKVAQMREKTRQAEIFADDTWRETFNLITECVRLQSGSRGFAANASSVTEQNMSIRSARLKD